MSGLNIRDALKDHGIRAEYKGMHAMVLPVDAEMMSRLDQKQIRKSGIDGVDAGQMILSWNEDGERRGKVINADANNDIVFLVERNDGTHLRISTKNMANATLELVKAMNGAKNDIAETAARNEEAKKSYKRAKKNGEKDLLKPIPELPAFDISAFEPVSGLVSCMKESRKAIKKDRLSDISTKANADTFSARLRDATRDDLTDKERRAAEEACNLRAEIHALNPEHPDAVAAIIPPPYKGNGEAARNMMNALPDAEGISQETYIAMANVPMTPALFQRLFSVSTTTPPSSIERRGLSHADFMTYGQELAKYINQDASDAILPRMAAVVKDTMEHYRWKGTIFSKDGADILLMRDEYGAYCYTWDSDSRIDEINVEEAVLAQLTQDDVPSDKVLEDLRQTLSVLRFDSGAEVDFKWDDPKPELEHAVDCDDGPGF